MKLRINEIEAHDLYDTSTSREKQNPTLSFYISSTLVGDTKRQRGAGTNAVFQGEYFDTPVQESILKNEVRFKCECCNLNAIGLKKSIGTGSIILSESISSWEEGATCVVRVDLRYIDIAMSVEKGFVKLRLTLISDEAPPPKNEEEGNGNDIKTDIEHVQAESMADKATKKKSKSALKGEKQAAKQNIKKWIESFTKENGREPTSEEKIEIDPLYAKYKELSKLYDDALKAPDIKEEKHDSGELKEEKPHLVSVQINDAPVHKTSKQRAIDHMVDENKGIHGKQDSPAKAEGEDKYDEKEFEKVTGITDAQDEEHEHEYSHLLLEPVLSSPRSRFRIKTKGSTPRQNLHAKNIHQSSSLRQKEEIINDEEVQIIESDVGEDRDSGWFTTLQKQDSSSTAVRLKSEKKDSILMEMWSGWFTGPVGTEIILPDRNEVQIVEVLEEEKSNVAPEQPIIPKPSSKSPRRTPMNETSRKLIGFDRESNLVLTLEDFEALNIFDRGGFFDKQDPCIKVSIDGQWIGITERMVDAGGGEDSHIVFHKNQKIETRLKGNKFLDGVTLGIHLIDMKMTGMHYPISKGFSNITELFSNEQILTGTCVTIKLVQFHTNRNQTESEFGYVTCKAHLQQDHGLVIDNKSSRKIIGIKEEVPTEKIQLENTTIEKKCQATITEDKVNNNTEECVTNQIDLLLESADKIVESVVSEDPKVALFKLLMTDRPEGVSLPDYDINNGILYSSANAKRLDLSKKGPMGKSLKKAEKPWRSKTKQDKNSYDDHKVSDVGRCVYAINPLPRDLVYAPSLTQKRKQIVEERSDETDLVSMLSSVDLIQHSMYY